MNQNKPATFSIKFIMFMVFPMVLVMMASTVVGMRLMMKINTAIWNELSTTIEKLPKDGENAEITEHFEKLTYEMMASQKAAMMKTMIVNLACVLVITVASIFGARYMQKKMSLYVGFDLDQFDTAITAYHQLGDALIKIKPEYLEKIGGQHYGEKG